jgi:hypothetical protein
LPPISRKTLVQVNLVTALLGQWLLDSTPQVAILILGICLLSALLDGWWFLTPLRSRWWYYALITLLGLAFWSEPRGWFFLAWAAIDIGTGLRAESIVRRHFARIKAEKDRLDRLGELGFGSDPAPEEDPPAEEGAPAPTVPAPPQPPLPAWRYPVALLCGLTGAWIGAWLYFLLFRMLSFQVDMMSIGIGYVAGKAVLVGAGDRSPFAIRALAAVLGGLGVLYARYLIIRSLAFTAATLPTTAWEQVRAVGALALADPGKLLGIFLIIFLAVGGWAGWHFSKAPTQR